MKLSQVTYRAVSNWYFLTPSWTDWNKASDADKTNTLLLCSTHLRQKDIIKIIMLEVRNTRG